MKQHYDPPGGPNGPKVTVHYYLISLIIATPLVLLRSGFNVTRAIDVYQQHYAHRFTCPYGRTGSCSETLRKGGIRALVHKCPMVHGSHKA